MFQAPETKVLNDANAAQADVSVVFSTTNMASGETLRRTSELSGTKKPWTLAIRYHPGCVLKIYTPIHDAFLHFGKVAEWVNEQRRSETINAPNVTKAIEAIDAYLLLELFILHSHQCPLCMQGLQYHEASVIAIDPALGYFSTIRRLYNSRKFTDSHAVLDVHEYVVNCQLVHKRCHYRQHFLRANVSNSVNVPAFQPIHVNDNNDNNNDIAAMTRLTVLKKLYCGIRSLTKNRVFDYECKNLLKVFPRLLTVDLDEVDMDSESLEPHGSSTAQPLRDPGPQPGKALALGHQQQSRSAPESQYEYDDEQTQTSQDLQKPCRLCGKWQILSKFERVKTLPQILPLPCDTVGECKACSAKIPTLDKAMLKTMGIAFGKYAPAEEKFLRARWNDQKGACGQCSREMANENVWFDDVRELWVHTTCQQMMSEQNSESNSEQKNSIEYYSETKFMHEIRRIWPMATLFLKETELSNFVHTMKSFAELQDIYTKPIFSIHDMADDDLTTTVTVSATKRQKRTGGAFKTSKSTRSRRGKRGNRTASRSSSRALSTSSVPNVSYDSVVFV